MVVYHLGTVELTLYQTPQAKIIAVTNLPEVGYRIVEHPLSPGLLVCLPCVVIGDWVTEFSVKIDDLTEYLEWLLDTSGLYLFPNVLVYTIPLWGLRSC